MFWISFLGAFASSDLLGDTQDRDLIIKIRSGEVDGMEMLYDKYASVLFGLLKKIVQDEVVAEDLLEGAFIQAWDKIDSYEETRGSVFSWLTTVARNKAIDHIRSKIYKTRVRESTELNDIHFNLNTDLPNPLDNSILADNATIVGEAVSQIPEDQIEVIEIAYYQGISQSEISEQLHLPLGTVKSRMWQGMAKIRDLIKPKSP